jgi:hypothetical protein
VLSEPIEFINPYLRIQNAFSIEGVPLPTNIVDSIIIFDTKKPTLEASLFTPNLINNQYQNDVLTLDLYFSEPCLQDPISAILTPTSSPDFELSYSSGNWISDNHYQINWDIELFEYSSSELSLSVANVFDVHGNSISFIDTAASVLIDTYNPYVLFSNPSTDSINETLIGSNTFHIEIEFNKFMDTTTVPEAILISDGFLMTSIQQNTEWSEWTSDQTLKLYFDISDNQELAYVEILLDSIIDSSGNPQLEIALPSQINIDTQKNTEHPAPFPEQLANDHIISWSNENDLVYDCFLGSGTTAKMSILNNRNYIGSELSKEYYEIALNRISKCGGLFFNSFETELSNEAGT